MTTATRIPSFAAIAAAALLAAPVPAPAQDGEPDNVIKYRQNVMKSIGGATSNIGAILKGDVPQEAFLAHALNQLADAAVADYTISAFRQSTAEQGMAETTALPEVWEDWDDFEQRLRDLEEVTRVAADAGPDVTQDQIMEIFDTCKGCHDEYRTD